MRGTSKVIMGATLVMVVSLAMVFGLILILLVELYCSLLLRRRHRSHTSPNTTAAAAATTTPGNQSPPTSPTSSSSSNDHKLNNVITPTTTNSTTPLSSFHAHGVLQAPRSLLFPAVSFRGDENDTHIKKRQHHQVAIDIPQEGEEENGKASHFVYISNPVYENPDDNDDDDDDDDDDGDFETPDTSPSRLEEMGDEEEASCGPFTPPLTPMKKLPPQGSSVSLRDARSLATNSGSDSNNTIVNDGLSSSSSGSPCTSPSW